MHFVTKYLITITDLLDIERGSPLRPGASGVDKFERVEDIDLKWVVKAEVVWKSSQWVKVLFKTAQELKETLVESEVEAFKVCVDSVSDFSVYFVSYLFYRKYRNSSMSICNTSEEQKNLSNDKFSKKSVSSFLNTSPLIR